MRYFRQMSLTLTLTLPLPLDVPVRSMDAKGLINIKKIVRFTIWKSVRRDFWARSSEIVFLLKNYPQLLCGTLQCEN